MGPKNNRDYYSLNILQFLSAACNTGVTAAAVRLSLTEFPLCLCHTGFSNQHYNRDKWRGGPSYFPVLSEKKERDGARSSTRAQAQFLGRSAHPPLI